MTDSVGIGELLDTKAYGKHVSIYEIVFHVKI